MKIIIQGAMPEELEHFKTTLPLTGEDTFGTHHFWHSEREDCHIILSQTQIGEANAAVATTLAITHYAPHCILNQGVAGAHKLDLHHGDIVIGATVAPINSFEKPTREQGISYPDWISTNFTPDSPIYHAHPKLVEFLDRANYSHGQKVVGTLGSGDVWNKEFEFIQWLVDTMDTHCEDMESHAVHQVASQFQIPTLGIRIISNNERTGEDYDPSVAHKLQAFLLECLPSISRLSL